MAECFISTTTPGKLHGLTPEIGMLKAPGALASTLTQSGLIQQLVPQNLCVCWHTSNERQLCLCRGGPGQSSSSVPRQCQTLLRGRWRTGLTHRRGSGKQRWPPRLCRLSHACRGCNAHGPLRCSCLHQQFCPLMRFLNHLIGDCHGIRSAVLVLLFQSAS